MERKSLNWLETSTSYHSSQTQQSLVHRHDLLTFLAEAQRLKVDLLPLTWQPGLEDVGQGGTAGVSQSLIDARTSFAYKRLYRDSRVSDNFKRLTSEVKVLKRIAAIGHPNIIQLEGVCWDIDFETTAVQPVLVFEKAQVGDVRHGLCNSETPPPDVTVRLKWCAELASAVHSLHENDIVHGDLKPGNLLVFTGNQERPCIKLADFGYTVMPGDQIYLPRSRPWSAPEWHQRSFSLAQAKQAEIFSYGLVCLWMMFSGIYMESMPSELQLLMTQPDEPRTQTSLEHMKKDDLLLQAARELLQQHSSLGEKVFTGLDKVFMATLCTNPGQRHLDSRQMASLLEEKSPCDWVQKAGSNENFDTSTPSFRGFQVGQSLHQLVMAQPEVRIAIAKGFQQTANQCGCHSPTEPCAVKRQACLQLALCHQLGFGIPRDEIQAQYWLEESQQTSEAFAQFVEDIVQHDEVPVFQDGLFRHLYENGSISQFDFAGSVRGKHDLDFVENQYRREIRDMACSLGNNHGIVISLKMVLSGILMEEGRLLHAAELENDVLKYSLERLGPDDHRSLMSMGRSALIKSHLGEWKTAEGLFRELVNRCEKTLGRNHPSTIGATGNFASTLRLQGLLKEAIILDEDALSRQRQAFGDEHPETLSASLNVAATYRAQNQLEKAAGIEKEVVLTASEVLPSGDPIRVRAESNLALSYSRQGRLSDAEKLRNELLTSCESALGSLHPASMANKYNLAGIYLQQGRWRKAEALLSDLITLQESRLGSEHPDCLKSQGLLALNLCESGRPLEAKAIIAEILTKECLQLQEINPLVLSIQEIHGTILLRLGEFDEAESVVKTVIEGHVKLAGDHHPLTLAAKELLGKIYLESHQLNDAETILQNVLANRLDILGKSAVSTLTTMMNLAALYEAQGKTANGIDLLQEATQGLLKSLGSEHPSVLAAYNIKAALLIQSCGFGRAGSLLMSNVAIQRKVLGEDHPETATAFYLLGMVGLQTGCVHDAVKYFRAAMGIRLRILGANHPMTEHARQQLTKSEERMLGTSRTSAF